MQVLRDDGYELPRVKTAGDLAYLLTQYVRQKGDTAVVKLLEIHPDKEAILEQFSAPVKVPTESFSNASGTGCGCSKMSASGCGCSSCSSKSHMNFAESDAHNAKTIRIVMISSLAILGLGLILRAVNPRG